MLVAGDKLEVQLVARGGDTVGSRVVGTINAALLSADRVVGADALIPDVSVIAVGRSLDRVRPAPVGVEHNAGADIRAGARGTPLPVQGRVVLRLQRASLLGLGQ